MSMQTMKHSILFILSMVICNTSVYSGAFPIAYQKYKHTETIIYHPTYQLDALPSEKAVIAWDLNNVVFTKKIGAREFISNAISHYGYTKGIKLMLELITLKKRVNAMRKKHMLESLDWEQLTYYLLRSKKEKYQTLATFIQDCVYGVDSLDIKVGKLMHTMRVQGYKQVVLSNMWKENILLQVDIILQKRNEEKDDMHIYDSVHQILSCTDNWYIPQQSNNWTHKPERNAYQLCLEKYDAETISIFIDDKEMNVKAAVEHGFSIGIVYKNPQQLYKDLQLIGFDLAQESISMQSTVQVCAA